MRIPAGYQDRVRGIDVSAWQGSIDWARVYREAGPGTERNFHFVGIKEGESNYRNADKYWTYNWKESMNAGFAHRIAYHFFHPNVSAREQADILVQRVIDAGGMRATDAIALDFEKEVGLVPTVVHDSACQFIELVQNALFSTCIVYTGAWYADAIVKKGSPLGTQPLWVASYTSTPRMPAAWRAWDIWQYGAEGYGDVPGINVGNNVDHNMFRSADPAALDSFFRSLRIYPKSPVMGGQNGMDELAFSLASSRKEPTP